MNIDAHLTDSLKEKKRKEIFQADTVYLWVCAIILFLSTITLAIHWTLVIRHFPISQWDFNGYGIDRWPFKSAVITVIWWGICAVWYDKNIDWPMDKISWMPHPMMVFGPVSAVFLIAIKAAEHRNAIMYWEKRYDLQ